MTKHTWIGMALAAAVLSPTLVWASGALDDVYKNVDTYRTANPLDAGTLTISPQALAEVANQKPQDAPAAQDKPVLLLSDQKALTLDDAASSKFQLHGFLDFRLLTGYLTPRGLHVVDHGVSAQGLGGLVFDVYQSDGIINDVSFVIGAWTEYTDHNTRWNELDTFEGVSVKFLKKWEFDYTVDQWWFPDSKVPDTEHNMEFKLSFDDTEYLKDFALHPYVNVFWNYTGSSSPVVANALLGKNDNTAYAEFGITPSYTYKGFSSLPITFTLPMYVSVGDSSFWGETPGGDRSNLGVFSTGLKISAPLNFIPEGLGHWNAYVGVTWIHTCNPALSYVNENIMGAGDSRERVIGFMGIGMGF